MAMTTMTDTERRVTGCVDTHKDNHVAAALDEVGRVLGTDTFPATIQVAQLPPSACCCERAGLGSGARSER